ncbi:MAG: hypothetical protein ACFFD2_16370 [Promethearchaeota archaeon]
MTDSKREKDLLSNVEKFEQKLRLRGSITSETGIQDKLQVLKRLGFTTTIYSEIKSIEKDSGIKIISPFSSSSQQINPRFHPTKFGLISPNQLDEMNLNPQLKRFRFINRFLLTFLLFVIIINFILFFLL